MDAAQTDAGQSRARSRGDRSQARPDTGEPGDGLTQREHDVLAFERKWWMYQGAKEGAIREQFNLSPTRYYQVLNTLLEKPEALRADPMLVKRLRRMRMSRQRKRAARRLGIELP